MATALSLTTRRTSAMASSTAGRAASGSAEGLKAKSQSVHNDETGKGRGISVVNGKGQDGQAQQTTDTGAESDVDELVDSDTEKAVESTKTARASVRGRAAKATPTASAKPVLASGKRGNTATSLEDASESKDAVKTNGTAAVTHSDEAKPSAPSPQEEKALNHRAPTQASAKATSPTTTSEQPSAPRISGGIGSSREMLGRTATGGPLPYYYAQPHAASSRTAASPRLGSGGKKLASGGAPSQATSKSGSVKCETGTASSESDDLTPQEVDKFMDLIEKYNLDGSNEDEMARSVTELYQEWLEWCAKRNVQSTKSKQALVSEFVRIHHGAYGSTRQQRAIGIVQGSRSFDHAGMTNAARRTSSNGHGSRTSAMHRSDAPLKTMGARAAEVATSAARGVRSPAVVSRPITPVPATYDGAYVKEIPAVVLEDMHRQIRDEIWKEMATVINQMVHEQVSEIVADNRAMASRIEQLEKHSDNLAQWVQHLNRVQEEAANSAQRATAVPAAAQPPAEYHHMAPSYHTDNRTHPNYTPRGGYSPAYASPKHGYAMPARTSPSPPLSTRSRGQHPPASMDMYERHTAGVAPTYSGAPPPPPNAAHHAYHAPHNESPHMVSARAAAQVGAAGGGGAAYYDDAVRAPPSEYGAPEQRGMTMRPYYSQSRDERMLPPHPGSPGAAGDLRQAKRARNGF